MFNDAFSHRVTNDVTGNQCAIFVPSQKMVVKTSLPNGSFEAVFPGQPGGAALHLPNKLDDALRFRSAQQKMSVVWHDAICIQWDVVLFTDHPQQDHEILSQTLVRKDWLFALGSHGDKTR
jgi:hypothetical protein